MRKTNLMRTASVTLAAALMMTGCAGASSKETTPAIIASTEDAVVTSEAETTLPESTEEVTEEATTEEPTAESTELEESTEETEDTSEADDTTADTEDTSEAEDTSAVEDTTETEPATETETEIPTTTVIETTAKPTVPETTTETPTTTAKPVETKPVETTTVAPETTTAPVVLSSISASISGTHYSGDTLTAADFTVTGKYSDGHTENLSGWAASPLTLVKGQNTITVALGNISTTTTITVDDRPAQQPTQPSTPSNPSAATYSGMDIVNVALPLIKTPYIYAGTTPSGFDCSGFVSFCYKQIGISVPTGAKAQSTCGQQIGIWDMRPGDIIVFEYPNGNVHTGLWISNGFMMDSLEGIGVSLRPFLSSASMDYSNVSKIYAVRVGNNTCANKGNADFVNYATSRTWDQSAWEKIHYYWNEDRLAALPTLEVARQMYVESDGEWYTNAKIELKEMLEAGSISQAEYDSNVKSFDEELKRLSNYSYGHWVVEEFRNMVGWSYWDASSGYYEDGRPYDVGEWWSEHLFNITGMQNLPAELKVGKRFSY